MKRIILTVMLTVISVSTFAQRGKAIYEKYSDMDGVEAVYISSAMFRMIGRLNLDMGQSEDVDISKMVRSLKGMYILNISNKAAAGNLANEVNGMIRFGNYELLMEAKDDGETVRMYSEGDDNTIRSFVMLTTDAEETAFICFDGDIIREDFEKAIASAVQ